MKRIICLLLATAFLLCGCSGRANPAAVQSADSPARVVGLSRSIAELWTLAGGTLTGVTDDGADLDTNAAFIGSLTSPSLEAILALAPDLVLLSAELPAHRTIRQTLGDMDIAVRSVNIDSFDDYDREMEALTALTGRQDLYQKNVTQVRAQIDSVQRSSPFYGGTPEDKPTYFAVRVSATKNKALKNDYFACAMLNDMGLSNIAADSTAFDTLDLEALLFADPDYIFVIAQGDEAQAEESFQKLFAAQPVWQSLSAVKTRQVFRLPKDYFQLKPNANWGDAYQYVLDILLETN